MSKTKLQLIKCVLFYFVFFLLNFIYHWAGLVYLSLWLLKPFSKIYWLEMFSDLSLPKSVSVFPGIL